MNLAVHERMSGDLLPTSLLLLSLSREVRGLMRKAGNGSREAAAGEEEEEERAADDQRRDKGTEGKARHGGKRRETRNVCPSSRETSLSSSLSHSGLTLAHARAAPDDLRHKRLQERR